MGNKGSIPFRSTKSTIQNNLCCDNIDVNIKYE